MNRQRKATSPESDSGPGTVGLVSTSPSPSGRLQPGDINDGTARNSDLFDSDVVLHPADRPAISACPGSVIEDSDIGLGTSSRPLSRLTSGSDNDHPLSRPRLQKTQLQQISEHQESAMVSTGSGSSDLEGPEDAVQMKAFSNEAADSTLQQDEGDSFDYRGKLAPLDNQELRSMVFHDVQVTHHVPRVAMEAFRSLHTEDRPSDSRSTKKRMAAITGLDEVRYDCCVEGCISYSLPKYANLEVCPIKGCRQRRFKENGKPYAQHSYIPIIHRLRLMYSDKERAIEMMAYRAKMDQEMETDVCFADHLA